MTPAGNTGIIEETGTNPQANNTTTDGSQAL